MATVAPVLFLAIAVQGRVYGDLLQILSTAQLEKRAGYSLFWGIVIRALTRVLWLLAWAVPLAGFASEGRSVLALYDQHADSGTRLTVLISTLYLLAGVVVPSMLTFMTAADKSVRRAAGTHVAKPHLDTSPLPDAGETDAV